MKVWAVDPGLEAGAVNWNTEWHSYRDSYEFFPMQAPAYDILERIDRDLNGGPAVIVVERFVQQSLKHTRQYDALEMIGALRWIASRYGATFVLQSRSDKARVPDDTLRALGVWDPQHPDAMDAFRHLLIYVARAYPQHSLMRRLAGRIDMERMKERTKDGAR